MRAPLSAIEPFSAGVSIAMRGVAASTARAGLHLAGRRGGAGRLRGGAGGWRRAGRPGPCRVRAAVPGAPGAGRLLLLLLLLQQRLLALLLHLRHADEELPADQHDRRQHDGENGILVVGH